MSTYDDSSLFIYPSGYKASVLFAQKPMDANGQLAFTRSNDTATRVASNGLIERVRTNLLTYSNDFSNVAWGKTNVTITSGQEDPFGGTTGWRYLMTVVGNSFVVQNNRTISGAEMTLSFWVKSNTGSNQSFQATANTGSQASPSFTATTSWQRFSWTFTSNANGNVVLAYSPSINCDLLVYGAQLETGVMTDYIPTVAAAVSVGPLANIPRIDYLGGGCGKLLLEPQRTNDVINNTALNNYTATRATWGVNVGIAPTGYQEAEKLIEDTTASATHFFAIGGSYVSGTAYTWSIYVKADGRDEVLIQAGNTGLFPINCIFNLSTQTATNSGSGTGAIIDAGNGWYRLVVRNVVALSTGSTNFNLFMRSGGSQTYTGNGTSGVLVWGVQRETATYETSVIPTLAASVTRGADSCSKTGISSLIGQTEGTLFVEINANATVLDQNFELGDGTSANRINLRLIGGVNLFQLVIVQVASVVFNQTSVATFAQGQNLKIAVVYKSGAVTQMFVNGVSVITGTAGSITSNLSGIFTGLIGGSAALVNSPVKQILVFKTALTNTQAIELTA